jgi:alpha-tubulin suppressor-like RCC1 family protein
MKLDVSTLGHRWKGNYVQGTTYNKGDVVRVGDNVKTVDDGGNLVDFAKGQQSVTQKGEILTSSSTPSVGKAGQVLRATTVGNTTQPIWTPTNERSGTKALKLVTGGKGQRGQMKYGADGGGYHLGAVMTDGTLRVWGRRRYGESGLGDQDRGRGLPTQAAFPHGTFIVDAWKTTNCMWAVDKDGQLWATGYSYLGNGATSQPSGSPVFVNISQTSDIKDDPIVDMCLSYDWQGYSTRFALGASGRVYSWGYNQYGWLGHGHNNHVYSPTVIPFTKDTPIAKMFFFASQYGASHLIDTEGYLWGAGYGEGTLTGSAANLYTHQKNVNLHGGVGVSHIGSHESGGYSTYSSANYRACSITMNDGRSLLVPMQHSGGVSWGSYPNSSQSYVGLDEVWLEGVKMLAVKTGGYDQAVALMLDGTVQGIGYSPLSGTGANTTYWTTYPQITNAIDMVGTGARHGQSIAILNSDGYVWDLGYNNGAGNGYQQSYPTSNLAPVTHTRPFTQIAKYGFQYDSENTHGTYALDDKGDVWVWGYGNYEQTDPNDSEHAWVPTQVKF